MRLSILRLTLASLSLFGCGDDSSSTPDAPKAIDAAPDAKPEFKHLMADEGGEVRFEYVNFPNGTAGARVTSFFFKDSGSTDHFPILSTNGCTDATLKDKWPFAMNPVGERQYISPGSLIIAGGPQTLTVPWTATAALDPFGRAHPANQWGFKPVSGASADGPTFMTEKTAYDVILTGSADMPAQVFDNVIYVPSNYPIVSPAYPNSVPLPAGTDQTFTWTVVPSNEPSPEYEVLSLVAFVAAGQPIVACVELNDGSITVPAAMIDLIRATAPGGGTIGRQTLTHVTRELVDSSGPTGRRIDFIGVWCYGATPFTVP